MLVVVIMVRALVCCVVVTMLVTGLLCCRLLI